MILIGTWWSLLEFWGVGSYFQTNTYEDWWRWRCQMISASNAAGSEAERNPRSPRSTDPRLLGQTCLNSMANLRPNKPSPIFAQMGGLSNHPQMVGLVTPTTIHIQMPCIFDTLRFPYHLLGPRLGMKCEGPLPFPEVGAPAHAKWWAATLQLRPALGRWKCWGLEVPWFFFEIYPAVN